MVQKNSFNKPLYSAHYQLGLTALKQGKIVQAFLSFVAYLLMYPEGKYESRSISVLSEISKVKRAFPFGLTEMISNPIRIARIDGCIVLQIKQFLPNFFP